MIRHMPVSKNIFFQVSDAVLEKAYPSYTAKELRDWATEEIKEGREIFQCCKNFNVKKGCLGIKKAKQKINK